MFSNRIVAAMSHDKTHGCSLRYLKLVGRLGGDTAACNNDKMSNDT